MVFRIDNLYVNLERDFIEIKFLLIPRWSYDNNFQNKNLRNISHIWIHDNRVYVWAIGDTSTAHMAVGVGVGVRYFVSPL